LLPNIDKKVFRKMPEEQTTHLRTNWQTAMAQAGCAAYNGMACLKSGCGFAASDKQFGFCSKCLWEAKHENLDLEMCVPKLPTCNYCCLFISLIFPPLSFFLHSRNLQQWKKQKQEYDTFNDQWQETKQAQRALYNCMWEAEVRFLEGTFSLFPCLGQLNLSAQKKVPSPALSLSSVATITSLQCLILRRAVLEEHQVITICNILPLSLSRFSQHSSYSIIKGDSIPSLIHLDLREHSPSFVEDMSDSGWAHLSKLTNLRSLDVSRYRPTHPYNLSSHFY